LRVQAHPSRRHGLQRIAVAALSVPVLARVYIDAATQRLSSGRPAIVLASLLVTSLAASLLSGTPAVGKPPSTYEPLAPNRFAPVTPPALATAGGLARLSAARTLSAELDRSVPEASPKAPAVVRFRPRAGQSGTSRFAAVSVRFTQPMDHASTERAFTASVGSTVIKGQYLWAEGDTVLVLIPAKAFAFGARVSLALTVEARSADGTALSRRASVTFAVAPKPPRAGSSSATLARTASAPGKSAWLWPLIGPITQYFGQSLTKYGFHYGIDIDGETGDPVRAARSGRVVVAGLYDQCGGLEIHIDHGDGLVSWYRHLSRIDVRVGARVATGTIIGRVGATGCALGSHLHFAIRRGTTFVDPLRYLPPR
jgi:murein DD-endopeptidase MepM/ murein hydrolase activator NlpD